MSSTPPNESSKTKTGGNFFDIPKYSWETESHVDDFTQEIPTYSWEFDTCSPIYKEDSSSTIVPDSQCLANINQFPKLSWESESQSDKYTKYRPTYSWEDDSCTRANVLSRKQEVGFGSPIHEVDNQHLFPDPNRSVESVQQFECHEQSSTKGGSTSHECKDEYDDYQFAQSPEKVNFTIDDVDAIKRELCDEVLDSPPKKKKGKKFTKWF